MTEEQIKAKASKKAHVWGGVAFVIGLNIIKAVPNLFIGLLGAILLGFVIDRIFYNIFYNSLIEKNK